MTGFEWIVSGAAFLVIVAIVSVGKRHDDWRD